MKVTLATPSLHPNSGGPAYAIASIGAHLTARGVEPTFWTPNGELHGARGKGGSALSVFSTDLVHNFGVWRPFNQWVACVTQLSRRPMVVCTMGMLEPWGLQQKALKKRLALTLYQRRILNRAEVLHASADSEAANLRAVGLKSPVAVIPVGVEMPSEAPQRGAIPPTRTALFLSRIHPKKGLMDLVRAWAQLRPQDWRLVIAGPDPIQYRAEVEAAVRDANLASQVSFAGQLTEEQKQRLFAEADLFVLPTYSENFGAVIPEALGYGVPVITTTGAPWSMLGSTRSGFWVEPGEAGVRDALARSFSLPPAELRAMGERGRNEVIGRYSWTAVIEKHIELYRWLVHGEAKPTFMFD